MDIHTDINGNTYMLIDRKGNIDEQTDIQTNI